MSVLSKYIDKHWAEIINKFNAKADVQYQENYDNFNDEIIKSDNQIKSLEKELVHIDEVCNQKHREYMERKSELEMLDKEASYLQNQIMNLEADLEDRDKFK
jgi:chromosome segregation ATPase